MVFKKGLNKRGQDLTIGTLILIVLGIVVLVLLIIGFTKGWGFIFDKFESAPGKSLQTTIESCNFAGQGGLRADYCLELKRVDYSGETQYVNCESEIIRGQLTTPLSTTCEPTSVEGAIKALCYTTISGNNFATMKVGDKTCFERFGASCSVLASGATCGGKIKKNSEGKDCCFILTG